MNTQNINKYNPRIPIWIPILVSVALLIVLGCCFVQWVYSPTRYETTDPGDYGKYICGCGESNYPEEFINQFFPEELSDEFENVQYVYHSNHVDVRSYEAYLEFTFASDELLNAHVQLATDGMMKQPFYFDNSYQEYVLINEGTGYVSDHIMLGRRYDKQGEKTSYQIEFADISKILVNFQERRIIYIALNVFDGGGTDTGFLNAYFDRFNIDPEEYEKYTEHNTPRSYDDWA